MTLRPPHTAITQLKLDDADLDELLTRLRDQAPPPPPPTRDRRDLSLKRHDCELRGILRLEHPGGQPSTHLVIVRNVSDRGLGVLHGRFCHPLTLGVMALRDRRGQVRTLPMQVRWCRYVEGSTHELGLQLHDKIDAADFAEPPKRPTRKRPSAA